MIDKYGLSLEIDDTVVTTVSKGSHYLTTAKVLQLDEENGKVFLIYNSTPAAKWRNSNEVMRVNLKPRELDPEVFACRDCTGRIIKPGDQVVYRTSGDGGFETDGIVKETESDLWVTLTNGLRLRNVGIFII